MKNRVDSAVSLSLVLVAVTLFSSFSVCAETRSIGSVPVSPSAEPDKWAYKFLGAETTSEGGRGVCAEISVSDPSVPHGLDGRDFFYAWIMVYSSDRARWIQVGWSDVGWESDVRCVTEYDTEHNAWRFYDRYPLVVGHSYSFEICAEGNGSWASWIWWNNRWDLLIEAQIGLGSAERVGEFCEVCTSTNDWFNVSTTTFRSTCLLTDSGWNLWTIQQPATLYDFNYPYVVNWSTQYCDWSMSS